MSTKKGVKHWLENALGYKYEGRVSTVHDDEIVILVDPDMLIQKPFVNDFSDLPFSVWRFEDQFRRDPSKMWTKVRHGAPIAQDYSFGAAWLRAAKANLSEYTMHVLTTNFIVAILISSDNFKQPMSWVPILQSTTK